MLAKEREAHAGHEVGGDSARARRSAARAPQADGAGRRREQQAARDSADARLGLNDMLEALVIAAGQAIGEGGETAAVKEELPLECDRHTFGAGCSRPTNNKRFA